MPPKIYFKGGCLEVALRELKGKQRAFIVTGARAGDGCWEGCPVSDSILRPTRAYADTRAYANLHLHSHLHWNMMPKTWPTHLPAPCRRQAAV